MGNKYESMTADQLRAEVDRLLPPDGVDAPISEKNQAEVGRLTAAIEANTNQETAAQRRAVLLTALETDPVTPSAVHVSGSDDDETYKRAFGNWLRGGMANLDQNEQRVMRDVAIDTPSSAVNTRALGIATGAGGGFVVPDETMGNIVAAMDSFGGLRGSSLVTKISTSSGADLPVPTSDDTANTGELLTENSQASEQDIPFGQKTLSAWVWSSKLVRVSYQLLQDEAIDLESFLAKQLGRRIGRAQAPFFITGTGASQPEGLMTNIATGKTTASTQTDTFIYDDFVDLEHSVDESYWNSNTGYVISRDALKEIRKVVDSNGDPIWHAGLSGDGSFPATINGWSYVVDHEMADVDATEKPVAFGDLSSYWVRDVQDVSVIRFDEKYADFLQVGFLAWARMDARPVDAGDDPVKCLEMAAS